MDMAHFNWLLFTYKYWEGKPNMALMYPESHVECRNSVLDGQINDETSKAALRMNLGFECKD